MQWIIFGVVQIVVLITVYSYFRWRQKKDNGQVGRTVTGEDNRELIEIRAQRARHLNVPLSEIARPVTMDDIIGQQDGIRALRAAMCGPNPQHVIIYGPPGIGKTCAARLVLEEAKKRRESPFNELSKFIEIDATCVRFDERAIADPLIGSVHDPIYQGAGVLGVQGVPQPKPGAVTRAHCGVLFLDEIGELHPIQMNKLLKVLEDRRVYFESAYYSKHNSNIPMHIHDIFQNGLPADFRLIGATTRSPEELPSALRSRCVEIFFSPLCDNELAVIAGNACKRIGVSISPQALKDCSAYASSGRDAVNIVQLASSVAFEDKRQAILPCDIEWVAEVCRYTKRHEITIPMRGKAGICYGLGVSGSVGMVIEIECVATKAASGKGSVCVRGAIEEEEFDANNRKLRRKSMAQASVENVLAAVHRVYNVDCSSYDIAFNIPGGLPMDGPSAGIALTVALMSALTGKPPRASAALTGEVTQSGEVRPVGGIREKLSAAKRAGAECVIIPRKNMEQANIDGLTLIPVSTVAEVMLAAFDTPQPRSSTFATGIAAVDSTAEICAQPSTP